MIFISSVVFFCFNVVSIVVENDNLQQYCQLMAPFSFYHCMWNLDDRMVTC